MRFKSAYLSEPRKIQSFLTQNQLLSATERTLYAVLCHTSNFLLSYMKIIRPVWTVFEGARSSKCQQPKIRFVSFRFGAMSAGLKDRHHGGSTIGNQYIATTMAMAPTLQGRNKHVQR